MLQLVQQGKQMIVSFELSRSSFILVTAPVSIGAILFPILSPVNDPPGRNYINDSHHSET